MPDKSDRRCGTCKFWEPDCKAREVNFKFCQLLPLVPFWATVMMREDHSDWTMADDGKDCPTWEPEEMQKEKLKS